MHQQPSINKLSQPLVQNLIANADSLRLKIHQLDNGCTIIDAGIAARGGIEAGRLIAEICMGGLGQVAISHSTACDNWPVSVNVTAADPVLACLGSQYAGWNLSIGKYYALGSGPARAMAGKDQNGKRVSVEELYQELGYRDLAKSAVLVIENDKIPPLALVDKIATACALPADKLTIIVTPTSSLAGSVQVVARVLEVAMHKCHELGFDLSHIHDGVASAPLCPPHPDFVQAMGRTNDAILLAGQVHLFVQGSDTEAQKLATKLPSSTSKDYGKPFAATFAQYKYDFFQIDGMLFSPAKVKVTAIESGNTFGAGKIDHKLLDLSFGY